MGVEGKPDIIEKKILQWYGYMGCQRREYQN